MGHRTWGGRFAEGLSELAARFNASLPFDRALWREDLWQNRVHARMLHQVGLLTEEELRAILEGLDQIEREIEAGTFPWREELEDVHMNLEARLIELIGPPGGKLHTARSRNDQVATDLRLFLRGAIDELLVLLLELRQVLVREAERHLEPLYVLPGYTHLQRAQPILLSHWFLAYYEMLLRDAGRLRDARERLNESPLGAAALAGTGFPIDRHYTARELGFSAPMRNSLDAVASRDFALEVLSALNIGMLHLSRMAEELILYSTEEFGFVEIPDAFATGSSIMPQKKNPDILELIRAKAGRVLGALVALSTVVKGLPLAYNKDLQEDKEPLLDAFATYRDSLKLLTALLPGLRWRRERMWRAAEEGYALATELADYLAEKGLPFREAHHVVGRLVRRLVEEGRALKDLTLEELKAHHPLFAEDALPLLRLETAIHRRNSFGGTAPLAVRERILEAKKEVGLA
ncbi:argininosuccinate lyase [Thermus scotoductus]|uniref:Argininosuccinate lyase n=1 Tax=Thermus scotoductus TaxID=37636 RepID=A0A430S698_THESC|nr:argininosuccinate lyase [Thermus scotoductus]RTG93969.1 argininosuccinate lyase [Thermus scotoductus]RTH06996.1 argininosuccinate lyase [Thermus scotoductus]RTH08791.1 argininosuccinate lyase [Thermus scotoductus]RTH09993.1 argininosuccinate lyase [Thermus scotoductus]RTH24881.1 argininosuccinate lyase [Thermus scotoductus]